MAGPSGGVEARYSHLAGMNEQTAPRSTGDRHRLEPLLTIAELSECLGIPVATLYDWRTDGIGPKAIKLGRALRYPQSSVRLWISEQVDA